jgi:ABC-type antimicrobial peptide transport system permease subunit
MFALRSWLRTPRLALTLLACIAISIGGPATVLTFARAVLLRPLPYPHPIALLASIFLLIVVARHACWIPAWRAARTDPSTALRAE